MKKRLTIFVWCLIGMVSLSTVHSAKAESVTLWSRGNLGYLAEGESMPLWPQLPADALPLNKPLILTMTMPLGFEITAYDTSTDFAVNPIPLIVPTQITSYTTSSDITYRIYLPDPPNSGVVRPALLINPGDNPAGSYTVRFGLQTTDAQNVWSTSQATITVLPRLQGQAPKRLIVGVYDYADYNDPTFKAGIASAIRNSGINTVANMRYFDDPDTIAQQLRSDGGKAGWVWFWSAHASAILNSYPEARTLNAGGIPVNGSLCYTWCIQNPDIARNLLIDYIQAKTTTVKFDMLINDNEEASYKDGQVYGDLYTPATLEAFRAFAGISSSVTLTPTVIASSYSSQWVNFRCWQCAEMSKILADAAKTVDPNIAYGVYSGYRYSSDPDFTKEHYSADWTLLGTQDNIDFGNAGYYGSTADLAATNTALGETTFVPAEMFVTNFLDHTTAMPEPDRFAYRLMKSTMYGGAEGGVFVWYAQVLDAAGFAAIAKVSAILAQIEDPLLDGINAKSDLIKNSSFNDSDLFAYQLDNKHVVVAFNNTSQTKNIDFEWNRTIQGSTQELVSGVVMQDPSSLIASIAPYSFVVFLTSEAGGNQTTAFDSFDSYAIGELQTVSENRWVNVGTNSFQVKDADGAGNHTARIGPWYWGDGSYYMTDSNVGADYTASVNFAAAPDWGGIDDDGRLGIFARRQADGSSVYARIYVNTNRSGSTAPTSASLTLQVNGTDYSWASGVPISYLESNNGHIELTLDGANIHVRAAWGSEYSISADFTVSGDLLNAGPAGIYGYESNGNYYYFVVDMDNFAIITDRLPGDANGDGRVDVGDLGILAANYGLTSGAFWNQGDFNSDGAVDVGDLGILAANYGEGVSGEVNFNADLAKAFGTTTESEDNVEITSDDTAEVAPCTAVGLPLIAGLAIMGLMLVKLEE